MHTFDKPKKLKTSHKKKSLFITKKSLNNAIFEKTPLKKVKILTIIKKKQNY